jgi:glycosidase
MMRSDALYPHPDRLIPFFGNHDLKRFLSEPGATPARLKLAFGILTTLRGTPQFYSGDEIAMRGNDDPDNRRDFPGGFPGDKQDAFDPATRTPEQQEMFAWVSGLLHLRSAEPLLQGTAQQNLFVDDTSLAYVRGAALDTGCRPGEAGSRILVVMSKADRERDLSVETRATSLAGCTQYAALYPQGAPAATLAGSQLRVTLGPDGFAIYKAQ